MTVEVRPFREADRVWAEPFLFPAGPPHRVVSKGRLHDPFDQAGLVAHRGEQPMGLTTYRVEGDECELLTIGSLVHDTGVGTTLIDAVRAAAHDAGCLRVWLVTTNDNTRAIRFYQRRGFRLRGLRPGAIDEYRRTVKPEIPLRGNDDIRIRDELELVIDL